MELYVEDDETTPVDGLVAGFAYLGDRIMVDSGPFVDVNTNSGFQINDRGAVYVSFNGISDHYHMGVPMTKDGRVIVRR